MYLHKQSRHQEGKGSRRLDIGNENFWRPGKCTYILAGSAFQLFNTRWPNTLSNHPQLSEISTFGNHIEEILCCAVRPGVSKSHFSALGRPDNVGKANKFPIWKLNSLPELCRSIWKWYADNRITVPPPPSTLLPSQFPFSRSLLTSFPSQTGGKLISKTANWWQA